MFQASKTNLTVVGYKKSSLSNLKYLFVLFCFTVAPMVSIMGLDKNWYVGQENVKFICVGKANPPARQFKWIRSVFPRCAF